MQAKEIIQYINHPEELNEYSLSELSALIKKYPYFETAHALFIVNLKIIEDPRFREYLEKTSIYIKDRANLLKKINFIENKLKKSTSVNQKEPKAADENKSIIQNENAQLKEKEYSREELRNRISHTISEQLNESDEKNKKDSGSKDFFILDKSPSKGVNYKKIEPEKNHKTTVQKNEKENDKFELEEGEVDKKEKISKKKIRSEYFNIQDYQDDIEDESSEDDLINKFLKETPEIKTPEVDEKNKKDMSVESTKETNDLISEKLATLYIKQGYYEKAISTYKKLSLKYPEKNDYFAEQITKLENKINKQ